MQLGLGGFPHERLPWFPHERLHQESDVSIQLSAKGQGLWPRYANGHPWRTAISLWASYTEQLLNKRCSFGTGGFPHSRFALRQQLSIRLIVTKVTALVACATKLTAEC
ncbi:hypothetical protein BJP36_40850 [Moorena producens JHB]|uniref:Uncharacterized protein n=1 Tax=Moorena producens (strain JHB) TaxID=1454205 RepID=A0A9Q9SS99_MOOP1|nr:hypothetical protein [Moorena producens]WAN68715.1 hypothetical protein BJP36_40850 [Moorena producens JHB]